MTADGTNTENIQGRMDRGFGIVNEIVSILGEIPLGPYRISVGLKLREAMLLNGMQFNSEIWYGLKEEEVQKLASVDEYLLRSILGVPSKTPKEALFLETGCIPVKYLLKMRRIMYLHHIVRRPETELIRKFYEAQKSKISKGDWVQMVQENMKQINLKMSDLEIAKMSKNKFKKIVKKHITTAAFSELIRVKETHSKMQDTKYNKLEVQDYLKSDSGLSDARKQLLVKLRTRMYGVKVNFKNHYENHQCRLCKAEMEDQPHLFMCQKLIENCESLAENTQVEYEDIFGTTNKQLKAMALFEKIHETRDKLIYENNL